ncbi:MAG: hypothetical protein ACLQIJ_04020 [Polyangia bacterium]
MTALALSVAEWQRDLCIPVEKRTRDDYRRAARWWSLESKRPNAHNPQEAAGYAKNMRYAAALVEQFGPGAWTELHARKAAHEAAEKKRMCARLAIVRNRKGTAAREILT